jgi:heat shock protein HtpX
VLQALDEDELRAVVGHEVSHLKNWDASLFTFMAVPAALFDLINRLANGMWWLSLLLRLALWPLFIAVGLPYLVLGLLRLYASRIREYAADRGSVERGVQAHILATALCKIIDWDSPSQRLGRHDKLFRETGRWPDSERRAPAGPAVLLMHKEPDQTGSLLGSIDSDRDGRISAEELQEYTRQGGRVSLLGFDLGELFASHPLPERRIRALGRLAAERESRCAEGAKRNAAELPST